MHPPGIRSFRIHQERKYTGLDSEHWVGLQHDWPLIVGGDHNTISILVEAESQNPQSGGQWCGRQLLLCHSGLLTLVPPSLCSFPHSAWALGSHSLRGDIDTPDIWPCFQRRVSHLVSSMTKGHRAALLHHRKLDHKFQSSLLPKFSILPGC